MFNFREKGEVVVHGDFNIAIHTIVLDEEEVSRLYHRSQHVLVDCVNSFICTRWYSDVVVDGEQVRGSAF